MQLLMLVVERSEVEGERLGIVSRRPTYHRVAGILADKTDAEEGMHERRTLGRSTVGAQMASYCYGLIQGFKAMWENVQDEETRQKSERRNQIMHMVEKD